MPRKKSQDGRRKPAPCRQGPSNADAVTEPAKVWPEKLIGAKYVRLLEKQLRNLPGEGAHGNRTLFLDDVFVVYLLAFFNPTIRSLWTIEDLRQTLQAQKHLSVVASGTVFSLVQVDWPLGAPDQSFQRGRLDASLRDDHCRVADVLAHRLSAQQIHIRLAEPSAAGAATLDEIMPILRERESARNWTARVRRAGVPKRSPPATRVAVRALRFRRCRMRRDSYFSNGSTHVIITSDQFPKSIGPFPCQNPKSRTLLGRASGTRSQNWKLTKH
jgi:hypothetical protein